MWTVYILRHSITKQIYIGFTQDLQRRLAEHNAGGQKATHRREGKWMLVYAEMYRAKVDAAERERMLKHHGSSKRKLMDRIRHSLL